MGPRHGWMGHHVPSGRMGPGQGWALSMDGPKVVRDGVSAWMGPHRLRDLTLGISTMCIGLGQGITTVVERV